MFGHSFAGGQCFQVDYDGRVWGLEFRLPLFSFRLTYFDHRQGDEGLTLCFLSPCCHADLEDTAGIRGPETCTSCGSTASQRVFDTWWEYGSMDELPERLERYLTAWGVADPLTAELEAVRWAERLFAMKDGVREWLGREVAKPIS